MPQPWHFLSNSLCHFLSYPRLAILATKDSFCDPEARPLLAMKVTGAVTSPRRHFVSPPACTVRLSTAPSCLPLSAPRTARLLLHRTAEVLILARRLSHKAQQSEHKKSLQLKFFVRKDGQ